MVKVHSTAIPLGLVGQTMNENAYSALSEQVRRLSDQFEHLSKARFCASCGKSVAQPVVPLSQLRPSDAILAALRNADRAVGINFLRNHLQAMGYPMDRFGRHCNYFYTLICRLIDAGKVTRLEGDEIMLVG